jgi:hypothetical protein
MDEEEDFPFLYFYERTMYGGRQAKSENSLMGIK